MPMITSVVPRLVLDGADRAIAFYQQALGAELVERFTGPGDLVVHAELRVGDHRIAVKDADEVDSSATTLGGSPVLFMLDVSDADAVATALEAAGATVVFPLDDADYGYRQARLRDPFGLSWMVSQRIEALSPAQTQDRLDAELR
jgi:PhnB protein